MLIFISVLQIYGYKNTKYGTAKIEITVS